MTTPPPNLPDAPPPPTSRQSTGYQLLEFREGHYVKVVDGEIVGKASLGDVQIYQYQKTMSPVESGSVEIGLAFTAVLALLFSLSWPGPHDSIELLVVFVGFKLLLGLLYFVTYLATTLLLTGYIHPKLPIVLTEYLSRVRRSRNAIWEMPGIFYYWLIAYYPKKVMQFVFGRELYWLLGPILPSLRGRMRGIEKMISHGKRFEAELAYLTLLATFALAGVAIPVYVAVQLVFDLV